MDFDSFTSLAWPEPGEEPGKEPAELTPTETTDALLPPECQLANPIDYSQYFGPGAFEPAAFSTRHPPRTPEAIQPDTAAWPTDVEVRPIMSVADWVRVANSRRGEEPLELKQDWGVRPMDTLLQAGEESLDPEFFTTYAADENDCNTELHEQDLAGKSTEPVVDEDEETTPIAPKKATRKATRKRRSTSGAAKPTNKKAMARKRKNDSDDLARRTCESCGTVFENWHAKNGHSPTACAARRTCQQCGILIPISCDKEKHKC